MTKEKPDRQTELLEQLVEISRNIFIMQAVDAGATLDDIRGLLHVSKERVAAVSKIRRKKSATA